MRCYSHVHWGHQITPCRIDIIVWLARVRVIGEIVKDDEGMPGGKALDRGWSGL